MEDLEMGNNPSMLSHISIGTNDFERAIAFYDAVLPTFRLEQDTMLLANQ